MTSTKSLNAKNLEALGAERLAQLLIEISSGDAARKRRLRLELAGTAGAAEVAHEVRKRLVTIAKARTFVDWQKIKALVADLGAQHRAIVDQIAPADPRGAFDLLWRLIAIADPVFARSDDSSGRLSGAFHAAAKDLGPLAVKASAEPTALADRVFGAIRDNGYGQYDGLIAILAPALSEVGLERLKSLLAQWSEEAVDEPRAPGRAVITGGGSPLYADGSETKQRDWTIRSALAQIADAQGDVDGYIAQQPESARRAPAVAAKIGQRLLDAGRAEEAWTAIEAAEVSAHGWIPIEWEQTRIDVLAALGRKFEAQVSRWESFARSLRAPHLRAYLKALPDFDDLDAEERAMTHALQHPNMLQALAFLLEWPSLDHASRLILARSEELDGDLYEILSPAADALDEKYPLATTLVRRAMIDFTLANARSSRYRHAARHLTECATLAEKIADYRQFATHEGYYRRLRSEHGRKTAFWEYAADRATPLGQ